MRNHQMHIQNNTVSLLLKNEMKNFKISKNLSLKTFLTKLPFEIFLSFISVSSRETGLPASRAHSSSPSNGSYWRTKCPAASHRGNLTYFYFK